MPGTGELDQEQIILHQIGLECGLRQCAVSHLAHEVMIDRAVPVGLRGSFQTIKNIHGSGIPLIGRIKEGQFQFDRAKEEITGDIGFGRANAIQFCA